MAKKPSKMSIRFKMLNLFVDEGMSTAGLNPSDKLVWIFLFRHTTNFVAEASHTYIAKKTGLSRSTVNEAIQNLKDKRMLAVVQTGTMGGKSNRYKVFPTPREEAKPDEPRHQSDQDVSLNDSANQVVV